MNKKQKEIKRGKLDVNKLLKMQFLKMIVANWTKL